MFKWFIFLYGQLGKHVISGGRRGRILGLGVGGTMLSFLSGKTSWKRMNKCDKLRVYLWEVLQNQEEQSIISEIKDNKLKFSIS